MTVQSAHTLVTASAAHAALRAAGKQIAELGPRLTTALQTLDRGADKFVRSEGGSDLAQCCSLARGAIDGTLANAAALVASGEQYYTHVALHGGAAAFIAQVEETLPGLAHIEGELEQALEQLELHAQTVRIVSTISDVMGARDQVTAALASSTFERAIEHLQARVEADQGHPGTAPQLSRSNERADAELREFAAKLQADYRRGRASSPDPAVEGPNGLKTAEPAQPSPATQVTPSRGEHGSEHGAY